MGLKIRAPVLGTKTWHSERREVLTQPATFTRACDDSLPHLPLVTVDGLATVRPESIPKQLPPACCRYP